MVLKLLILSYFMGLPDVAKQCLLKQFKPRQSVKCIFWENKGKSGIYNCGTGHAHTYNEVAEAVIAALGKGEIAYREFPEVLKGKYQNFTEADTTNLLAAGYNEGFHEMNDAVKEYVDFLNKGGYFAYNE